MPYYFPPLKENSDTYLLCVCVCSHDMVVLHLWLDAKIKVGVLHVGSSGCCLSVWQSYIRWPNRVCVNQTMWADFSVQEQLMWKLLYCKLVLTKFFEFVSAGSWCGAGRVTFSHGACHWRRRASAGFSKCRGLAAISDTCSPQTRSCSAGCCGGHHGGQLWTGERSASFSFHLPFGLCVDAFHRSSYVDMQMFIVVE